MVEKLPVKLPVKNVQNLTHGRKNRGMDNN